MKKALTSFMDDANRSSTKLDITDNLQIRLSRTGRTYPSFFLLGSSTDLDSGGFVVSEIRKNLEICSKEKSEKIKKYQHKYSEWWLVLVDYIGYGLDNQNRKEFFNLPPVVHTWSKIVLLDPLSPCVRPFEIK